MSSVHMTMTITSSLKSGVTGTIMNPEPSRTITSDDWDQKYDEPNIQQPILSTMTDDLGNTVAAHLLDSDIDDSPPVTDDEYPSKDETEKEDEFDLPAPVAYPLLLTITM